MADYRYNARDDDLVAWNRNFTSRHGDGGGDPEEHYLSTLRLVAACRPRPQLLDIGCGLGRVIDLLRYDVGSIVGLEPDPERFGHSRAAFHDGDRVVILDCPSDRYKSEQPGRTFDIVVVSMVIQHVSTATCDRILADVHDLLAADGIGVIATTQQDQERFTRQSDPTPLSRETFDDYAADSSAQAAGIPVRQFSKASFLGALQQAGLDSLHWGQFSYIRPEKLGWFSRWMNASVDAIRDVGTSQYAVVRRRP
jgi:SAM-dependent methyltransferase